jgi:two-component sensor histidine kinase
MAFRLDSKHLRKLLAEEDACIIEQMAQQLQMMADIAQADVFIDVPLPDQNDCVLVVAQVQPATAESLYKGSVVGQKALQDNEPGVFYTLQTGRPLIGSRAISQEYVTMQQNIVPILNPSGKTIGICIMEQDITEKVRKEKNVEMLIEATESLSEVLLQISMPDSNVPDLIHEGIILFSRKGVVSYTNTKALSILQRIGFETLEEQGHIDQLGFGMISQDLLQPGNMVQKEYQYGEISLQVKLVSIFTGHKVRGGILLMRDISDLKRKDKELTVKSAVIKEIHHRVKNNLQTISSLLRLQMRRSNSTEVKQVFRESMSRINSISLIHEVLAQEGIDVINCKEIIKRIIKIIKVSFSQPSQVLHIELLADDVDLPSGKATSLVLVVNELIQNCVNHAFTMKREGNVRIEMRIKEDYVRLTVSDDGVGIQANRLSEHEGHLGLQIVETLVREDLNGTFDLFNSGQGTEACILFPISQEE